MGKLKKIWSRFWDAFKSAYNAVFKHPKETPAKEWRDLSGVNLLAIFVDKLNNLTNTQATFDVTSDSVQAEKLKTLCKSIESNRYDIVDGMLADGDYYIFPATDSKGELYHSYLTQGRVRIISMDAEQITEAYGIIDWYVDTNNKCYYLFRRHKLDENGTLHISYLSVNEDGKSVILPHWEDIVDEEYAYANANHIGFGRYKSPASSRGLSPVYGVPLNYACADIEKTIQNDLKMIDDEFRNGKSVIFTDPRNLLEDEKAKQYRIADNVIPVQSRGNNVPQIDIFNPNLRFSEHYSKLVADMALYEKTVGTSKGILTDNETAYTATATAVRRANADTLSLIDRIRSAIDDGNKMTLEADAVFLNVSKDLWAYSSDWYDPFEEPDTQWQRLVEAKQNGVAEDSDLIRWLYPKLTDEEIQEKIERIKQEQQVNTDEALERILRGQ
jgi:hypothetical protein